MKTFLLSALLALCVLPAQAQSVTASTDLLEVPPTLASAPSAWESVMFTNQTDDAIEVFGLGANGPFGFDWECSGGDYAELPARGTCVLDVRLEPAEGQQLGVVDGLVGFRLATGTVDVDLRGFVYTPQAILGLRNLRSALIPLGFAPELVLTLDARLQHVEMLLLDGNAANDRGACGQLQLIEQRVLREAEHDRVREWSAAVLVVQKDAIKLDLDCEVP